MKIEQKTVPQRGTGHPDYAVPIPAGQPVSGSVFTMSDPGELAARLYSPSKWDRRGNVIWMDNFSCGVDKWSGKENVTWDANHGEDNGFSAKFLTSAPTYESLLSRYLIPFLRGNKGGIELAVSFHEDIDQFQFILQHTRELRRTRFAIQYNPLVSTLRVWNEGVYASIDENLNLFPDVRMFHAFKLVVDYDNNRYVRLMCDGNEYDLSGYIPETTADLIIKRMEYSRVNISCSSTIAAVESELYLDKIILTKNEP